jgi:XTP/dITP diphosphohydrolase
MLNDIIVASGNAGKIKEIAALLADMPVRVTSLKDYWNPVPSIPENGDTFLDNARIKAQWVFDTTGRPSLADDSGLVVDALNGEPGVHSARYAGEPSSDSRNTQKLLAALAAIPREQRSARFVCTMVLIVSADEVLVAEGTCGGHIGFEPAGDNGFGYDPVFIPDGYMQTFAQLDESIKNTISHRAKALVSLKEAILAV